MWPGLCDPQPWSRVLLSLGAGTVLGCGWVTACCPAMIWVSRPPSADEGMEVSRGCPVSHGKQGQSWGLFASVWVKACVLSSPPPVQSPLEDGRGSFPPEGCPKSEGAGVGELPQSPQAPTTSCHKSQGRVETEKGFHTHPEPGAPESLGDGAGEFGYEEYSCPRIMKLSHF